MLYCFDVDGTLVRSFLSDGAPTEAFDRVEVLPGRTRKIERLAARPGAKFALVTNQAGVAFGYQSTRQVFRKLGRVVGELDLFFGRPFSVHVAFEHPTATIEAWRRDGDRRKPGPGMILEAMERHRHDQTTTWMVGDMESDRLAASAAGVKYIDAEEFFQ